MNIGRVPRLDGTGYTDLVCIVWQDRFADETGFRVRLEYGSGEAFEYFASANGAEFSPPAADVEGMGGFTDRRRKDYGAKVWAIRPGGEEVVVATFVQVM